MLHTKSVPWRHGRPPQIKSESVCGSLWYQRCFMHLWSSFWREKTAFCSSEPPLPPPDNHNCDHYTFAFCRYPLNCDHHIFAFYRCPFAQSWGRLLQALIPEIAIFIILVTIFIIVIIVVIIFIVNVVNIIIIIIISNVTVIVFPSNKMTIAHLQKLCKSICKLSRADQTLLQLSLRWWSWLWSSWEKKRSSWWSWLIEKRGGKLILVE